MKWLIPASFAALAVAMCIGHGVRTKPILADDQLYYFSTERCASGEPPHVSRLEVKTQLPTLIGGATIWLGRHAGLHDVHSGRIATVVAAAAATVLGWLLALELTGRASAGLVAGAAMLSILGLYAEAATGFQPKIFLITFLLLAHLGATLRWPRLTGAAGACAFLCWQPGALVLAACALASLLDRRATLRSLVETAAAALAVLLAYEAWFAWHGALTAQIHQEFVLPFSAPHKPVDWAESFWFVLTEARAHLPRPNGLPMVFAVATVLLWVGVLISARRAWTTIREQPGLVAFWVAAHLTTAFTLYDHQAFPDMLLVQPYFAVACGIAFAWLARGLEFLPHGSKIAALMAALCVWLGLSDARLDIRRVGTGRTGLDAQISMGHMTSLYLDHRGSVWALGPPHLLALNRVSNWTPVGNVGHETSQLDMKTYRPLRNGQMPEIILASRGLRPGFRTWLPAEYLDITPAAFAKARIRVFSRRSAAQPGFDTQTAPKPAR